VFFGKSGLRLHIDSVIWYWLGPTVGCAVLRLLNDHLEVRPSLLGKASTFLQMLTVAVVMLQWRHCDPVVWISGVVTLLSGFGYIALGIRQLQDGGHTVPVSSQPNSQKP